MNGVVRSQVQEFTTDVDGVVTIKIPFENLHVFEVQIFFPPNVPFKWYGTNGDTVSGVQFDPADKNVISYKQPLKFYVDPSLKRSDQFKFQRISGTRGNIVVVFSYIDQ